MLDGERAAEEQKVGRHTLRYVRFTKNQLMSCRIPGMVSMTIFPAKIKAGWMSHAPEYSGSVAATSEAVQRQADRLEKRVPLRLTHSTFTFSYTAESSASSWDPSPTCSTLTRLLLRARLGMRTERPWIGWGMERVGEARPLAMTQTMRACVR